ncbi:hypothetical protein AA313_de0203772 [Arthrobotrys entomopaga]|nr:hypothetical protein AA313_de0203772 [Arthrobotrys entomopaga]
MDLLKGPIREGSRGGRGEFKWSEVKDSKDREYYLGVSVKAPTGRWQQNRDIQWYSRDKNDQAAIDREKARAEEIRKIKEAENDALSAALGFKVTRRQTAGELSQGEVDRAIKEAEAGGDERDSGSNEKGVGFGRVGVPFYRGGDSEVMAGNAREDDEVKWMSAPRQTDREDKRDERDRGRRDRDRDTHHDREIEIDDTGEHNQDLLTEAQNGVMANAGNEGTMTAEIRIGIGMSGDIDTTDSTLEFTLHHSELKRVIPIWTCERRILRQNSSIL